MKKIISSLLLLFSSSIIFAQSVNTNLLIDFLKISTKEKLELPISLQINTLILKNEMQESAFTTKLKNKIPVKALYEINEMIKKDTSINLKANKAVKLFSKIEMNDKHIVNVSVEPYDFNTDSLERKRIEANNKRAEEYAITAQIFSLPKNEQRIYCISNLFFNKLKNYCLFYSHVSTVGKYENEQLNVFQKVNKNGC